MLEVIVVLTIVLLIFLARKREKYCCGGCGGLDVEPLVSDDKSTDLPSEVEESIRPDEKVEPVPYKELTPMMNFDNCNQWGVNPGYTQCYPFTPWDVNNCDIYSKMDVDEYNSWIWRRRNYDKKILDGWASKNADYYKKHFYNELEKEEAKIWWGNNEY